jgi:hypothetical protein
MLLVSLFSPLHKYHLLSPWVLLAELSQHGSSPPQIGWLQPTPPCSIPVSPLARFILYQTVSGAVLYRIISIFVCMLTYRSAALALPLLVVGAWTNNRT